MKDDSQNMNKMIDAAMNHLLEDQYAEAAEILHDVLQKKPDHEVALLNLGIVSIETGDDEGAERIFSKLAEKNREDPDIFVFWADALTSLERYQEAASALKHALTLDPNDPNTWSIYSSVLAFLNREEEAAEAESRATELHSLLQDFENQTGEDD